MDEFDLAHIDADMGSVFQELFKIGIEDELNSADREILYTLLRLAYVHGRQQGRLDIQPLLQDATDEIARIANALRGL